MARFVPFIVDAGDNQKIGVKITQMKKRMRHKRKKSHTGRQAGCRSIFRVIPLKNMR